MSAKQIRGYIVPDRKPLSPNEDEVISGLKIFRIALFEASLCQQLRF